MGYALDLRTLRHDEFLGRVICELPTEVVVRNAQQHLALAELREELRVALPLERICKLPASTRTDQEFIFLYRGVLDGQLRPNPKEIEAGAFFAPDIIDGWIKARAGDFSPAFLECWKAYREKEPRNAPNEGQTSS